MAKNKKSFRITDMLNESTLSEQNEKHINIHYKKLHSHKKNHYTMESIDELADAIQDIGLLQDVVVKKEGQNYLIIAGHRRVQAIKTIVEKRGDESFSNVPCLVINEKTDETTIELMLHLTNLTTRELSEHDKMVAISEMKNLIIKAKKEGKTIKGKVRDIISDSINLGTTQVQKYMSINDKASDDIKEKLKDGEITVQQAYDSTKKNKHKESTNPEIIDSQDDNIEYETDIEQVEKSIKEVKPRKSEIEIYDLVIKECLEIKEKLSTLKMLNNFYNAECESSIDQVVNILNEDKEKLIKSRK